MVCPKCNADIGETQVCPNCDKEEVVAQEVVAEEKTAPVDETLKAETASAAIPEAVSEEENVCYVAQPVKSNKNKSKIIIAVIAIVAVVAAVAAILFAYSKKSGDDFVERPLYIKDNAVYYVDSKSDSPVLISEKLFKNEDVDPRSQLIIMNGTQFTQKGNKVFYCEKIDIENNSFDLYYRLLNKPEEDPVKLAQDVVSYVVDDKGETVIYADVYNNVYTHNMVERDKIVTEAKSVYFSKDRTKVMYLVEDGGLYVQIIGGEKDKIDSDVTVVYSVAEDNNFEYICYMKESDLYVKKADSDKIKVDTEVLEVLCVYKNGGIYYTKENEVKGGGTLLDYVTYPKEMIESDKKLIDNRYASDWRARNEAFNRVWAKEVFEKVTVETFCSLYYFDGETSSMINDAYVDLNSGYNYDSSAAMIFRSYDNVDIKKVDILDFVNALDEKHQFRKDEEKGVFLSKEEYQNLSYFDDFKKTILGAMESEETIYLAINGVLIEIEGEKLGNNFSLSTDGSTLYYIDNYDSEKDTGDLMVANIVDGALSDAEVYDTEVSGGHAFGEDVVIYVKDRKDDKYDLYINKKLVEYDVAEYYYIPKSNEIVYFTEFDSEKSIGTLNVYKDGEKNKIAEEVFADVDYLDDGTVFYFLNFSKKSFKGDLYMYEDGESVKIDYDVCRTVFEEDLYNSNMVCCYASILSEVYN